MRVSLTAQKILTSPDYFPLRLEGPNVLFVKMSRHSYQQSIFTMPSRIVTDGDQAWSVPLADVVAMMEAAGSSQQQAQCIFQIAHCGSTLLSRALDFEKESLVIREPFILRQICAVTGVENKEQKLKALKVIWSLLSRAYTAEQRVIVKANVPVNYALPLLLENNPQMKGVLLHIEFDDYLVAILKSQERQSWAKHVCLELASAISTLTTVPVTQFNSLEAWQAATLLWSSQAKSFHRANSINRNLMPLDAGLLFENPFNTLETCNQYFQLGLSSSQLNARVASTLFSSHAKDSTKAYSTTQRAEEVAGQKRAFSAQLDQARRWAVEMGLGVTF